MVFGFLTSNEPRYLGVDGRPYAQSSRSPLAFLSGMFGGTGTPAYAGAGQPTAASSGTGFRLFPSSPRYALPPVEPVSVVASEDAEPEASSEAYIVTPDAKACAEAVLQRLQDKVFDND